MFRDEAFGHVGRKLVELRKERCVRYRRMVEKRQRVLRPGPKPVRVRRPFDVELVAEIKRKLHALALDLVEDDAIVDAFYANLASALVLSKELLSAHDQRRRTDGIDAEQYFARREVRISLLRGRIEIHQDNVFGIVLSEHDPLGEREEIVAREPGEPARPVEIETLDRLQGRVPRVALHGFVSQKRWKALQLDELGRQFAALVPRYRKVDDRKGR